MIRFLRAFIITPGLIPLWHFLYPFLLNVLQASSINSIYLDNHYIEILLLLFLTFWFYHYADGFFYESEMIGLTPTQMLVCAAGWMVWGVWHLLFPPFVGVSMWYGLYHYTQVPTWLVIITSVFLFIWQLQIGWTYPDRRIAAVTDQTRFL